MGQNIKIRGIVLSKTDYKDSDRILTLFSPEKGKITASAKGVKKQNSKLRAGSELFAFGYYILNETRGRYTVTGYDSIDSFHELREDFDRLAFATLMLKITEKSVFESDGEIFSLLIRSLDKLRSGNLSPTFVSAVFLLKLCSLNGYEIFCDKCVLCEKKEDLIFLSPDLGGFCCTNCKTEGSIPVTGGCFYYVKHIIASDFESSFLLKPTEKQAKELFISVSRYTAYFFDERIKILDYISKYNLV